MILDNIKINADDFGLNSSVNKAIIEAFDRNYINSTTIMANMPGFEEAVYLIHKRELNSKIGAHLVLTEGIPLTEDIKTVDFLFKSRGQTKKQLISNLFFLNKNKKKLIFNELCAQIEKIKKNGILITHLDTHHHTHEFYAILDIIFHIKKIYQIPTIRILNNLVKASSINKKIYRSTINYYVKKTHSNHSDLFGNQSEFLSKFNVDPEVLQKKSIEIMVHPDYDNKGKLIDKCSKENLNFNFSKICNNGD
jgi:predicted glycoside hydrolase/deacetylase ChbG (UPF0249 family)